MRSFLHGSELAEDDIESRITALGKVVLGAVFAWYLLRGRAPDLDRLRRIGVRFIRLRIKG